jgi:hypothetical protein
LIDNLGWIDRGALWTYDVVKRIERLVPVEGASFLSLRAGRQGFFRVVHGESHDSAISIRYGLDPGYEVASVRIRNGLPVFEGDSSLWEFVDDLARVSDGSKPELVRIDAVKSQVKKLDLSWYSAADYDLGYQALVDAWLIPGSDLVIVSVQRSSRLVVLDAVENRRVAEVPLKNRGGNPMIQMRSAVDFVASDYDTLCRVDLTTMSVASSKRLQVTSTPNTSLFIGGFVVQDDGTCVVARPYSGDVLLVDSERFELISSAPVGGQPLSVHRLPGKRLIRRDWKSGRVSEIQFSN